MKITVKRFKKNHTATIGRLYIDGKLFSYTLEDTVRNYGTKVYGKTAIWAGKYDVRIGWSNRFKRLMPRIEPVDLFEGILIHDGLNVTHTHGCILVGYFESAFRLRTSTRAFNDLFDKLVKASKRGEKIELEIINEPSWKIKDKPAKVKPAPVNIVQPEPVKKTPKISDVVQNIDNHKKVGIMSLVAAFFETVSAYAAGVNWRLVFIVGGIAVFFAFLFWAWYRKNH